MKEQIEDEEEEKEEENDERDECLLSNPRISAMASAMTSISSSSP